MTRIYDNDIRFENILNFTWGFCGVDGNTFCISAGDVRAFFEVKEDPSDGFRSFLDCVSIAGHDADNHIYFSNSIADVLIEEFSVDGKTTINNEHMFDNGFSGYRFIDVKTGHVWLLFGTQYDMSGYYPSFTFLYMPDKEQVL